MLIDAVALKKSLEKMKNNYSNDVVDRCYNLGLSTAINIVESYEEALKKENKNGK